MPHPARVVTAGWGMPDAASARRDREEAPPSVMNPDLRLQHAEHGLRLVDQAGQAAYLGAGSPTDPDCRAARAKPR